MDFSASAKKYRGGAWAIALCAVLWSTGGLFIKLVPWNPVVIAGLRSFLAALALLGVRAYRKGGFGSREFRRLPLKQELFCTIAGGFAYAATMIAFVMANKLTNSANAIALQYSAPLWAALIGWGAAGEKPRWESWLSLGAMGFGMVLFFRDSLTRGSFRGDALALFAGICFGANSVFMRMIKEGDPSDSMLLSHLLTSLFALPFLFVHPPNFTPGAFGATAFMGIVQIGAASLLFSYGIKRMPAFQAMLLATIEPILNPIWVFMVTRERPTAAALAGGLTIIASVLFSAIVMKRRERAIQGASKN